MKIKNLAIIFIMCKPMVDRIGQEKWQFVRLPPSLLWPALFRLR
jgi:hypothetical protein